MNRYLQLDSLRGLAALSVVFHHMLFMLPEFGGGGQPTSLSILALGPLHLFWAGHRAVVLFFVLSGFVLSLSFYKENPSLIAFVVRRICRICIPYWFAVLLAFIAFMFFSRGGLTGTSVWVAGTWREPITLPIVLQHLLLIGSFDHGHYDPVLWSLAVEMRVSLVFPLLMLCINRLRWQTNLFLIGLICYMVGRAGQYYATHVATSPNDYWATLMYVYMFIAGALLAKHAAVIGNRWRKLPAWQRYVFFATALVLYTYESWLPGEMQVIASRILGDFPAVAAVSVFIAGALNSGRLSVVLLNSGRVLLGKIRTVSIFCTASSYSLS